MKRTRLFQAIVIAGCALATPLMGCGDESNESDEDSRRCDPSTHEGGDADVVHGGAVPSDEDATGGDCEDGDPGWQPTK